MLYEQCGAVGSSLVTSSLVPVFARVFAGWDSNSGAVVLDGGNVMQRQARSSSSTGQVESVDQSVNNEANLENQCLRQAQAHSRGGSRVFSE